MEHHQEVVDSVLCGLAKQYMDIVSIHKLDKLEVEGVAVVGIHKQNVIFLWPQFIYTSKVLDQFFSIVIEQPFVDPTILRHPQCGAFNHIMFPCILYTSPFVYNQRFQMDPAAFTKTTAVDVSPFSDEHNWFGLALTGHTICLGLGCLCIHIHQHSKY